jgi:ketosteroid isomerase-like protein
MDADAVRALGERWYRAFLAGDPDELAVLVPPDAAWLIPGETQLSGSHRGPQGIVELRRRIAGLTSDTWRPLREDSADVTASQWHAVVLDRYVAERERRRLDSHEVVVLAVNGKRVVRLFHYLHDPVGFAAFWSP